MLRCDRALVDGGGAPGSTGLHERKSEMRGYAIAWLVALWVASVAGCNSDGTGTACDRTRLYNRCRTECQSCIDQKSASCGAMNSMPPECDEFRMCLANCPSLSRP